MSLRNAQAALSWRRSSDRSRVMIVLARHRAMFPTELARACRMDSTRLREVVFGRPPRYRIERAPATLGFITTANCPDGDLYVITPAGIEEARRLARGGPERRGHRS